MILFQHPTLSRLSSNYSVNSICQACCCRAISTLLAYITHVCLETTLFPLWYMQCIAVFLRGILGGIVKTSCLLLWKYIVSLFRKLPSYLLFNPQLCFHTISNRKPFLFRPVFAFTVYLSIPVNDNF